MTNRARAALVLWAWPLVAAAAGEPASPPASAEPAKTPAAIEAPAPGAPGAPPATATGTVATPASPAAVEPSWKERFSVEVGWGYYEVSHAGVAWHVTDRGALDLFGGGGLAWDAKTLSVGLGFRHDIGGKLWTVQAGWDLKAIYWTQSDANYDWKSFSAVLGAYAVRELDNRLALKLDAGVALSGALQSDRKQDVNFGNPKRWNGSVCLELVYRLGR